MYRARNPKAVAFELHYPLYCFSLIYQVVRGIPFNLFLSSVHITEAPATSKKNLGPLPVAVNRVGKVAYTLWIGRPMIE